MTGETKTLIVGLLREILADAERQSRRLIDIERTLDRIVALQTEIAALGAKR